MDIKEAKYHKDEITKENVSISITLNNSNALMSVPMDEDNTDYQEILRQLDAGTLTIKDAE